MALEFLLEVGTEEIPSAYIESALNQMAQLARKYLSQHLIEISGEITTFGTPRRLGLIIKGLSERQADTHKEILGPPENVAYDKEGKPTKTLYAFLNKFKARLEELTLIDTNKGRYVVLKRFQEGRPTHELLAEILPGILSDINWPKSMRWGNLRTSFARPIHWIVAVVDGRIVPFEFGGVRSGNITYGHRFMSEGPIEVRGVADYLAQMEKAWVMVDINRRKKAIVDQIREVISGEGLEAVIEEELLDEVANLVEWPFVLRGKFEERFLNMPDEVLITVMKTQQRYFPVMGSSKRLAPYFLVTNNTKTADPLKSIRGNERVLRARFQDAEFFYQEDLKVPLLDRLEGLRGVIFHVSLGSYYDKVTRMLEIVRYLAPTIAPQKQDQIELVLRLSKCDLLTHIVFEFPELQGIIGSHYAFREGYPIEIARAVEEHYWPLRASDDISKSDLANCVGIADRMDTIVGFFAINQIPTGNTDPFALRRHALAILRIIDEMEYNISLSELIKFVTRNYAKYISLDKDEVFSRVYDFFKERLKHKFLRSDYDQEIIDSVVSLDIDPVYDVKRKIQILQQNRRSDTVSNVILAFKRINNIIKGQDKFTFQTDLLKQESELELIGAFEEKEKYFKEMLKKRDYLAALNSLSELKMFIDRLFEEVEIMSKDPNIRAQRLGLLLKVRELFFGWADFSKLNV